MYGLELEKNIRYLNGSNFNGWNIIKRLMIDKFGNILIMKVIGVIFIFIICYLRDFFCKYI